MTKTTKDFNVAENIHARARGYGERVAIGWIDNSGHVTDRFSYAELYKIVSSLSGYLATKQGLTLNHRVVLTFTRGIDFIVTALACLRIGVTIIPVRPPKRASELPAFYNILSDSDPIRILSSESEPDAYVGNTRWHQFNPAQIGQNTGVVNKTRDSDLALIQYTSGSTDDPKGVMISHANLAQNLSMIEAQTLMPGVPTTIISWLPHYHDMGLIGAYLTNLYVGSSGYYMHPATFTQRPNLFLNAVSDFRATFIVNPNFAYDYMVDRYDGKKLDFSALENVLNGSEPVKPETVERFHNAFKHCGLKRSSIRAAYGLAESTLFVCQAASTETPVRHHRVSCGNNPEIEIKVVDPQSHQGCEDGKTGEIWISSPSNSPGYLNKPEINQRKFEARISGDSEARYLRTGDVGFMDNGELYVCGRYSDIIIINGKNFHPQDIENTVTQCPGIARGGVSAFQTGVNGKSQVVILAESAHTENAVDPENILRIVVRQFQIPVYEVVICKRLSLPRTTSGKIRRLLCRRHWQQKNKLRPIARSTATEFGETEEESPLEKLLIARCEQDTPLEHLGFDSLSLADLSNELSRIIGLENVLPLDELEQFSVAEVRKLATSDRRSSRNLLQILRMRRKGELLRIHQLMKDDSILEGCEFASNGLLYGSKKPGAALITGASGFLGAHILYSLLTQTDWHIIALVRADNDNVAVDRIVRKLQHYSLLDPSCKTELERRLTCISADLSQTRFGLGNPDWNQLAESVESIFHCAATTHYVSSYNSLRGDNVLSTREIIRFAATRRIKTLHHVSSTFVFGWSFEPELYETSRGGFISNLDFGYAQSKWVAEQLVWSAGKLDIPVRIYRPALISASRLAAYNTTDIFARSMEYLINHGVVPDLKNHISLLPVDTAATHIVALSKLPDRNLKAYHLTMPYTNLPEICSKLGANHGFKFESLSVDDFFRHINTHGTRQDSAFPLIGFFNQHRQNIEWMQSKRYSRKHYLEDIALTDQEPPGNMLDDSLDAIVKFLENDNRIGRAHRTTDNSPWTHGSSASG